MSGRRRIRETLKNVAARLRSPHAGERDNARRIIRTMCEREGLDPGEFGVPRRDGAADVGQGPGIQRYAGPDDATRKEAEWQAAVERLFARINAAAPYIDAGHSEGWPPSLSLKILYCAGVTGGRPGAPLRWYDYVDAMLERARNLWRAGIEPPNPFLHLEVPCGPIYFGDDPRAGHVPPSAEVPR